jgi:hypothetical protein
MNLPDAPIAREGFFATHFFTVPFSLAQGDPLRFHRPLGPP